jgi:6,7-dimethyl-8-ribityllumazine synthase
MTPIVFEGQPDGANTRVGIVVSRFNDLIGQRLLKGALETLEFKGTSDKDVEVAWVPGAWEIPVTARRMVKTGRFEGLIVLGAIIRGETTHHEVIGREIAGSLMRLTDETGVPVSLGILTTENLDQALARAGEKNDNKGVEAALHLLETLSVLRRIK